MKVTEISLEAFVLCSYLCQGHLDNYMRARFMVNFGSFFNLITLE